MKSLADVMEHAGLSVYAEIALVLFLLAFAVILWWVLRPANRKRFESDKQLPLDDGQRDTVHSERRP